MEVLPWRVYISAATYQEGVWARQGLEWLTGYGGGERGALDIELPHLFNAAQELGVGDCSACPAPGNMENSTDTPQRPVYGMKVPCDASAHFCPVGMGVNFDGG
jgi:hypothetical protein